MEHEDEPVVEVESVTQKGVVTRFGKYRSLGRIGQGGMADVFLAVGRGPAGFNKLVVIKRLRDTVASDDAFRDMFLDEARLAARLNHPNVVQTYEVFEDEGAFFITMEYLEGQPLGRILRECTKRGMRLQSQICARIVSDVLCGLHYAHEACDYDGVPLQIVHRDVSPQNIFVTYDGQVKVVDFGIAKAERSSTKTQAGFFKGKAAYMAPEQLESGPIDRRVDVFTTGIVLWELLVGKRLMAAETTAKTLVRLLRDPIPHVGELVAGIDPDLDRIVSRALQRDPAARYQTAGEMRNALEQYLLDRRLFVRHEELGRLVGDLFSEARAERQRQVSEHMAVASEFPRSNSSGSMPAAVEAAGPAGLSPGIDPTHPSSMSGIAVARTLSSLYAARPPTTGLIEAPPQAKGIRLSPAAVAVMAVVSVAAIFTLVERTRTPSAAAPPPPSVIATIPSPVAVHPPLQPVVAPTETGAPEPARFETTPPTTGAPTTSPGRTVQSQPAWRPARPQWSEPKQSGASARPAAPSSAVVSQETNAVAPSVALEVEAGRPNAAPSPPPVPSAPATQEGRKFRTSL